MVVVRSIARVAAICVPVLLASRTDAHQGSFVIPILELPTSQLPDLDDASLEDWEAFVPEISQSFFSSPSGQDPSDLAWRVFLAWHFESQRLLIGVERLDDVFYPVGNFTGDRFDFSVDADHSGGQFQGFGPEEANRSGSTAQSYLTSFRQANHTGEDFLSIVYWEQWPSEGDWADHQLTVSGEAPSRVVLEASITAWDSLSRTGIADSKAHRLEANQIIGLQLVFFDEDGTLDVGIHWLTNPDNCQNCEGLPGSFSASSFADALLIPCQIEDCSAEPIQSSVAADSWARIKTSLVPSSKNEAPRNP